MRNEKLGLFTDEEMVHIQEESNNTLYGLFSGIRKVVGGTLIAVGSTGLAGSLGAIPVVF